MKTFVLVFLFLLSSIAPQDDKFCEGFEDGYIRGYCYEIVDCIEPIPPLCPIPEIYENTYEDGYNRGFLEGLKNQE